MFSYRFRGNDPVNPDRLRESKMMNSFEEWIEFFGIR